jgi:hypothetical protein
MYLKHKKKVNHDRPKRLAVVSVTESGAERLVDPEPTLNTIDMPSLSEFISFTITPIQ